MNIATEIIRYGTTPTVFTQMDTDGLLINFRKYRQVLAATPQAEDYKRGMEYCRKELERRKIFVTQ